MKKLVLLTLIGVLSFLSIDAYLKSREINHTENSTDEALGISTVSEISYVSNSKYGLYMVMFPDTKELKYLYSPQNKKPFKDTAEEEGLVVAINAGYFSGNYTDAIHAGYLYLNQQEITPMAFADNQITHVVNYSVNKKINFIANKNYGIQGDVAWAFQTGPLILDNSILQKDLIEASTNGLSEHKRTLLGYTDKGQVFFAIITKKCTLIEAARMVLEEQALEGSQIALINLDGGLSTALYSKDNTKFSYNTSWFLPNTIGF